MTTCRFKEKKEPLRKIKIIISGFRLAAEKTPLAQAHARMPAHNTHVRACVLAPFLLFRRKAKKYRSF